MNRRIQDLQLTVSSKERAEEILASEQGRLLTHVVSIGEPESECPKGLRGFMGHLLRLEFDDITAAGGWSAVMAGYRSPAPSDALALVTFFKCDVLQRPEPRVLIHCAQGLSRSAASALTLLFMNCGDAGTAAAELRALEPPDDTFYPNPLFIALLDAELEANSELVRAAGLYRLAKDNDEGEIARRREEFGG